MSDVTLPAVLFAGLISFLSPCVLPLVPPYLTYLAGATLDQLTGETVDRDVRRRAILAALCFVAGLATVFVALGASASAIGALLGAARRWLANLFSGLTGATDLISVDPFAVIAGLAIIVMGLNFLGVFRIGFLYRDTRQLARGSARPWGAYVMGLAFALGWSPCIGPVLATVLTVAGRDESVGRGALLLAVYAAGLGIPFVVAALAMRPFVRFLKRFRAHLGTVEKVTGGLLVLAGFAFLTGAMTNLSYWLLDLFPVLGRIG